MKDPPPAKRSAPSRHKQLDGFVLREAAGPADDSDGNGSDDSGSDGNGNIRGLIASDDEVEDADSSDENYVAGA